MEKLSFSSYVWKCVLGTEALYIVCLVYGTALAGAERETHDFLWSIAIPGFTFMTWGSAVWGAAYVGVLSAIFGSYVVWMHNSSLRKR